MTDKIQKFGRMQWLVIFALVGILLGVYSFTYSGRIESGDTLTLFNATASLVDFGDVLLDKTAADNPPEAPPPVNVYPLSSAEVEPLQLVLSAPLYWLAEHIEGIGLVHAVWFFNIFVCSAIVVVFYVYAVTLGYSSRGSVIAAIMLGIGSTLWPYSKTFFREPLACLFILLAALSMERWRGRRYRSFAYLVASILSLAAAFLTKEAVIFALPALALIVFPSLKFPKQLVRGLFILFLALIMGLVLTTIFAGSLPLAQAYEVIGGVLHRTASQIATAHLALHTYLLSVGGSVWGTSPVLVLAFAGIVILYRQQRYRYPLAILVLTFSFSVGYAILRGEHWFGGLSWPPRFLLPIIPFLMLGTLPMFEMFANRMRLWWVINFVGVVCLYSLWVQVCAVSYSWGVYINFLPPEANGLGEWGGGLNSVRYLRWVLIPSAWGQIPLDFAWVRLNVSLWPLVCVIVSLTGVARLIQLVRKGTQYVLISSRRIILQGVVVVAFGLTLIGLGLRSINADETYSGKNAALRSLLTLIQSNTRVGDVLLLADNEYEPFFLNHGKLAYPRVISLPDAPGEQPSPEQPPALRSPNPDVLLVKTSVPLIHTLAQFRSTLWLLQDLGPFHPWAIRPVERFMVSHYYPIRELTPEPSDPRVRLIEYSTIDAPDPFAFRGPDNVSDLEFGDDIHLLGFTLPSGLTYTAGDIVPISLYWQSEAVLQKNYTQAYFVADLNGNVVAQGADTQPAWGFAPTSGWQAGIPQWDNRALRLPSVLSSGVYEIWLRLYQSDDSSIQLPVKGKQVKDATIGILPIQITVKD